MSGRNGTAGRRGGRETATAPVSDAGEDATSATATARATVRIIAHRAKRCDTLDALDALAADAEDAARYIPEGGDGALAEAVRSEMLAAIDGRRELLAERAARSEACETADLLAAVLTSTREQAKRDARTVSQRRVASMCGVTLRQVKRWEGGKHRPPVVKNEYTGREERYTADLRRDPRLCEGWCKGYRLTRKRKARYSADLPTRAEPFNPDTLDTPADIAAERGRRRA